MFTDVAKCNLGKVRLEPMQSAVMLVALRDLWGGPQILAGRVPVMYASPKRVRPPTQSPGTSFPSSSIGDEFKVPITHK